MTDILMAPRPWTYAPNSGIVEDANGKPVAYLPARFANQADGAKVANAITSHGDLVTALEAIANGRIGVTDEMLTSKEAMHVALTKFSQDTARAALAKATAPEQGKQPATELNAAEIDLLKWLSQEDFSQYGECHGKTLDSLIVKGLAQVHQDGGEKGSFIAKGRGQMFNSVSLTEAGITARKAMTRATAP